MPKVSVIIPTRNRAHFLQGAIQSVLNQSFQDFEIIIVDDASEDETKQVVQNFKDARIRYTRHERNRGQGATRNAGIRQALGEYVAFLDDDDEWLPQKLEKQVQLLDAAPSRVGLIYTGFSHIDASSKQLIARVIPEKRGHVFEDMGTHNLIGTCSTVLLRKVCLDTTGLFDERLASEADYDLWIRVAKDFDVEYVEEPLVLYSVHGNRISTNHASAIQGMETLLTKHASLFSMNRKTYSRFYVSLGTHYCYEGDLIKGREAFVRAIRLFPYEIRHYYNLCLSLMGAENFRKVKKFRDDYLPSFHVEISRADDAPLVKRMAAFLWALCRNKY